MKKNKKAILLLSSILLVLIILITVIWIKSGKKPPSYECTNFAMGTYIQQTAYGKNGEKAAQEAAKKIGELENLISWRINDSDINKINSAAGSEWKTINPKTTQLLKTSLDVAKKSKGAFDPTILPITSMWDFGGDNQHVPSKTDINNFIKYVDYNNLRINENNSSASLKLHYMGLDLGAIGKGAACQEAVSAYKEKGADYGIVAVGGSIGIYGSKPDGSLWNIAVRNPKKGENQELSIGTIEIDSGFVSTSGTYEKEFTENGVTYHHLLNPKTGYPVNNGLVSVTVVCDNGALSDALSTACFVLGKEEGVKLLNEYNAEGIFIDNNNKIFVTENLKNHFRISDSQYSILHNGVK